MVGLEAPLPPCVSRLGSAAIAAAPEHVGQCPDDCRHEWAPCALRKLQTRQHVCFAGDPQTHIFKVESGALRLYRILANGRRWVIGFAYTGDLVGLGIHDRHPPNIQAIVPTQVRCLPKTMFIQCALEDLRFAFKLYEAVSLELNAAQDRALIVGQHSPEERLAAFLLGLSRRNEQRGEDPAAIALPMPRPDIADHLGLTTETVCRTFTKFRQRELIALRKHRSVRVLDLDALQLLAQGDGGRHA